MITRIDHVSIAVRDYDRALTFFQTIFGGVPGVGATEEALKFYWRIVSLGDLSRLELITPTGDGSFLDGFLKNRKEGGVHHITMETPDIHQARAHLERNGIPYFGFDDSRDNWKELFIHPKDAFGVLIQISQLTPDDWLAETLRMPDKRWLVQKTEAGGRRLTLAHPGGGSVTLDLSEAETRQLIADLSG